MKSEALLANLLTTPPTHRDAEIAVQLSVNLYMYEGNLIWSRFNAMLVLHGIVIAATAQLITAIVDKSSTTTAIPLLRVAAIILACVGIASCIAWQALMTRGFAYHDQFLKRAQDIAIKHFDVPTFPFTIEKTNKKTKKLRIRDSITVIIGILGLAHLGLILVAIFIQ